MRLRYRFLSGVMLFVVLFWGVGHHALATEEAALRPLLGAWRFTTQLTEEGVYRSTVFVDEIHTKENESPFVLGVTDSGIPLTGEYQRTINPESEYYSPYRYFILWRMPAKKPKEVIFYHHEFNFLSPDRVAGVAWVSFGGGRRSPNYPLQGLRVCKDREPCPYR